MRHRDEMHSMGNTVNTTAVSLHGDRWQLGITVVILRSTEVSNHYAAHLELKQCPRSIMLQLKNVFWKNTNVTKMEPQCYKEFWIQMHLWG